MLVIYGCDRIEPGAKPGFPAGLQEQEEVALVEYIKYLCAQAFPPRRKDVRLIIQEIIARTGRPCQFKEGGPSDKWFRSFLSRHPELSEKVPQPRDKARSRMGNEYVINTFMKLYSEYRQYFS